MLPAGELVFCTADSSVTEVGEGRFAKNILVLMLEERNSSQNRAFITKVLEAARINLLEDTLLAEIPAGRPVNCFTGLPHHPEFVFVFGLLPAQVGITALPALY